MQTIIEMVNHTRLDCMIGSAALMRQALTQALHHAAHRGAFGRLLVDQLMRNVLADLALESEAATTLMGLPPTVDAEAIVERAMPCRHAPPTVTSDNGIQEAPRHIG